MLAVPASRRIVMTRLRRLASAPGKIDMFQGQPQRLLVPGLVQCLAGPDWVEQCRSVLITQRSRVQIPPPLLKAQVTGPGDDPRALLLGACKRICKPEPKPAPRMGRLGGSSWPWRVHPVARKVA